MRAWSPPVSREHSAPAERQHDGHKIVWLQRMTEIAHAQAIDKYAHIRAQPLLLVDDAETQARVALVEVSKELEQRVAGRVHVGRTGVGAQRARNQHFHISSATSTA